MDKKYRLGIAYIHPICPLSLSHVKVFVITDTFARFMRTKGYDISFPLAMHYSGNSAIKIAEEVRNYIANTKQTIKDGSTLWLIKSYYNIPESDLKLLTTPMGVLDYFAKQQVEDLKKLNITCDFNKYYTTKENRYEDFIKKIFSKYNEIGIISELPQGKAIHYGNTKIKSEAFSQLNATRIIGENMDHVIYDALEKLNDYWVYERDNGIGTDLNGKIIEPMSDSELFSMFEAEKDNLTTPTDMFFAEEHLKHWIAKRIFTEVAILPPDKRTKAYFMLGLARFNGKTTSASSGCGPILPQLLREHGPQVTRLALLLSSHPSKSFEWNDCMPKGAKSTLQKFLELKTKVKNLPTGKNEDLNKLIENTKSKIEKYVEDGDFRRACLESVQNFPKELIKIDLRRGKGDLDSFIDFISYVFVPEMN